MGRGYPRVIGVKKFWLITGLLGLEVINLQVLVDFLGSGLSAAVSVLWVFIVVVIIGSNIEEIMDLLHGRYTLDKQDITNRLEEISQRQEDLEGKYQEALSGWEKKINEKLTMMINDMPQMVEHVEAEIVKNSEESKQSLIKSLTELEQGIKEAHLFAKEQREKTQEKISELLSELVNVSKQITDAADNDKRQTEELGRQCNAILESIGREVAGLTQQVDSKTGAITQLLEIKATEVEGRLTAGTDKHAEMLKVSVDAIRQQVMRSDESLVHTINKMQLETEERVKLYKRMVETAFAELTAEFVELEGDSRLRHKEVTAQISDNGDLLKRSVVDTEEMVKKAIEVLTSQIEKNNEVGQSNLERIAVDIKDGFNNTNTVLQNGQKTIERQKDIIQQNMDELKKGNAERLNSIQIKMAEGFAAIQKDGDLKAKENSAKFDNVSQDIIQRMNALKESTEKQVKALEKGKENIQQDIKELKKETLDKLTDVHMNLVDSYAALQKDEETKTRSRLAKFDIAIKEIIEHLNTLKNDSEIQSKLLESNIEEQKEGIKQGWDGLLKALTGDIQQLRREFTQATKPLSEQLSKVAENVADVKTISSEQQQGQDNQQDDYRKILVGQENLQNDLRTMEANISSWQEPWDLLDGMEKRLASLQSIIDTIASQQKELLTTTVAQQAIVEQNNSSKKDTKKSKKSKQEETVVNSLMEQIPSEWNDQENIIQEDVATEPVPILDPNRTETIEDKENNSTILREFRDNEIYKDMMMSGDVLRHEIYYDAKGNPKRAINYDDNEDIKYELEYYPNGEAKKRIEYVKKNGKQEVIVSNFDEQGHKLS